MSVLTCMSITSHYFWKTGFCCYCDCAYKHKVYTMRLFEFETLMEKQGLGVLKCVQRGQLQLFYLLCCAITGEFIFSVTLNNFDKHIGVQRKIQTFNLEKDIRDRILVVICCPFYACQGFRYRCFEDLGTVPKLNEQKTTLQRVPYHPKEKGCTIGWNIKRYPF